MPPYEVLDFFAGAARVSHLSRGLGQSTASFDIGFHHDPSVFDINSPAGLVCLSWEVCFWDTFRHQATNVESKAKVFIKNKLIYLYIYIYRDNPLFQVSSPEHMYLNYVWCGQRKINEPRSEHHFTPPKLYPPNHPFPSVPLRLSVYAMLNSRFEEALASVGLCCSSFVVASRGSTHRSFITPMGNEEFLKVRLSNQMTSRTVPTADLDYH